MKQDELFTECEQFRTYETLDEFHKHLNRLIDQLGFKGYLYGVLPDHTGITKVEEPPLSTRVAHNPVWIEPRSTFDRTWLEYYQDKGYALVDYAVHHCRRADAQAIVWRDIERHMTPAQWHICRQAIEAGCTNGLTIPMKGHLGVTGAISVSAEGRAEEYSRLLQSRKHALEMIANAFHDAILDRHFDYHTKLWKPRLTNREIEVLQWLAHGYTNEQVADRLTISPPTVRKHINTAKHKLDARNSVAACVKALKWRYIR